jgi:hypothetical protein
MHLSILKYQTYIDTPKAAKTTEAQQQSVTATDPAVEQYIQYFCIAKLSLGLLVRQQHSFIGLLTVHPRLNVL